MDDTLEIDVVEAFKCSDGSLWQNQSDALEREKEIQFENKILELLTRNEFEYTNLDISLLKKFIDKNKEELKQIFIRA